MDDSLTGLLEETQNENNDNYLIEIEKLNNENRNKYCIGLYIILLIINLIFLYFYNQNSVFLNIFLNGMYIIGLILLYVLTYKNRYII